MEEAEEAMELGKENEAAGNVHSELLSCVQELEDELKDSEQKRIELIHGNTALQNKLKATQEEEGRICQEKASLEERLLSVLSSQVRRMVVLRHQTDRQEFYVQSHAAFPIVGWAASPTTCTSIPPSSPTATSARTQCGGWS